MGQEAARSFVIYCEFVIPNQTVDSTVKAHYNVPRYNMLLVIMQSGCGSCFLFHQGEMDAMTNSITFAMISKPGLLHSFDNTSVNSAVLKNAWL